MMGIGLRLDRSKTNLFAALALGTTIFTGCTKEVPEKLEITQSPTKLSESNFIDKSNSQKLDLKGIVLSDYLEESTKGLHTQSRKTKFIESYSGKESYIKKDQYVLNLVQRYSILSKALVDTENDPRMKEIFGKESFDLLARFAADLEALGKDPSQIVYEHDLLDPTKECLKYIESLSPEAKLAVAHIYVGGAGNGGRYIARGLQKCLDKELPVSAFTGTTLEDVDAFEARIDALNFEHFSSIIEAEKELFLRFNRINNDAAFGQTP